MQGTIRTEDITAEDILRVVQYKIEALQRAEGLPYLSGPLNLIRDYFKKVAGE